ncbi:hypothetical protein GCM10011519_23430 [Marmoricola endophyticus]|uniref:Gluconate 2-dehydrogenase subunit 3 family protein n=1 Tax=Marmoricola endophyticus TaxID=2040280 RepID=A0A917BLA7_9ACTN|nr:hypothetical protein [Marmoricola endophyticus]GGF48713.1 hypothetical protein GCM10011519_23430 [Marmoricola endophyticus]
MADLKPALVSLLRAAYPHPSFPDAPYERTADTILGQLDEDLWHRLALEHGLANLDTEALADPHSEAASAYLRSIEDAEFFAFVRGVTVVTLYNDHEVWDLLGYEGASYDKGGYVERGFDDLDWLPDPRIEEYDGPDALQPVADADQPTAKA